jgi:hypothetical protein
MNLTEILDLITSPVGRVMLVGWAVGGAISG